MVFTTDDGIDDFLPCSSFIDDLLEVNLHLHRVRDQRSRWE
jgi:hypothetical protein